MLLECEALHGGGSCSYMLSRASRLKSSLAKILSRLCRGYEYDFDATICVYSNGTLSVVTYTSDDVEELEAHEASETEPRSDPVMLVDLAGSAISVGRDQCIPHEVALGIVRDFVTTGRGSSIVEWVGDTADYVYIS